MITVNMAKARDIHRQRLREARAPLFNALDVAFQRAMETGADTAEIVAKMVEGGIQKFLADITLLGQPFVKDDKLSIEKMLAAKKTKLADYQFYVVGEGIEKKTTDFAAEVMAQAGLNR